MFSMPTMHERISWFCGGYIAVSFNIKLYFSSQFKETVLLE